MNRIRNRKGFTLLEILIVIVILGIVAGLAIPVFTSNVMKSRAQEAYASLGAIRNAMATYWAQQTPNSYSGASLTQNTAGFIGYDPAVTSTGQTLNFTYALSNLAAGTYTVTATCV